MKVVLDTSVLISALFWNGHPRRIVDLAIEQRFQAVTSLEILQELQSVLIEDFEISPLKVKDILRDTLSYAQLIKAKPVAFHIRDLDDLKVLSCAVTVKADYIVTGDKDLLVLDEFHSVRIVTPANFIKTLSH